MESLLSLAFDSLSSYDTGKIRKGLRQIEGLLAQICLSRNTDPSERRRSLLEPAAGSPGPVPKSLATLRGDLAFREFYSLQDGFEWNVSMRLITCLDRLLGKGSNGQNDLLILSTLDIIRGVLLLHPPSRALFAREIYMNLLLDLLDPSNCPAIQSSTLVTLVVALLDQPCNTRAFETQDGLLAVTSLFKQRATAREVKKKLVEFLYFYLMPETSLSGAVSSGVRKASVESAQCGRGGPAGKTVTRSAEEKQALLGRYLNNVEDLVMDLRDATPFGTVMCGA
ncbi:MAG: hypothetical protein M1825_002691 [Sarcosagium campestre]|nr:MAG: hypothetical protein M1825_002691 [Sarcosagium campestre]